MNNPIKNYYITDGGHFIITCIFIAKAIEIILISVGVF